MNATLILRGIVFSKVVAALSFLFFLSFLPNSVAPLGSITEDEEEESASCRGGTFSLSWARSPSVAELPNRPFSLPGMQKIISHNVGLKDKTSPNLKGYRP